MDPVRLEKLLKDINTQTNEEYNNEAEHLKSLQDWVHKSKDGNQMEEAKKALIDANGLNTLIQSMLRNKEDTVVANRALDIIAGTSNSNGSLPMLTPDFTKETSVDPATCRKVLEYGMLDALKDTLRLPDLQAVTRGVACRALRLLIKADSQIAAKVVKEGMIEDLLGQVIHVDKPYVFGALAEACRKSQDAVRKIKEHNDVLPLLLQKFNTNPNVLSPEEDPAASQLFLLVWEWDEIYAALQKMGYHDTDCEDVLRKDSRRMYRWYHYGMDTMSPCLDFVTELGNTYFFIHSQRFQFLGLMYLGIVYNTTMSTQALMAAKTTNCWKVLLNICTFGYFNLLRESRKSWARSLKGNALMGLKSYQKVNSMIRFFVGTYSLLIAGYLGDYPEMTGVQLLCRWLSVMSSLLFIPATCVDVVIHHTQPGERHYGQAFRGWSREKLFFIWIFLYQGSEVCAQVSLLIFQIVARPIGIFVAYSVFGSLLWLYAAIMTKCGCSKYVYVHMPQQLFWTTNAGSTTELQHMSRAGSLLRVLMLTATWYWVYLRLETHPRLMEHLHSHSNIGLFTIGVGGSVVHVMCYLQQLLKGRWWFEDMDMSYSLYKRGGDYAQIADTMEKGAAALYDTAAEAPYIVLERWTKVHQLLPEPNARVPHPEFVQVHKMLASAATPSMRLDENSPFVDFLNALFVAATGLMYPKEKKDLGKHCFGYASLVQDEFYAKPSTPPDKLGLLSAPAIGWFDPLKVVRVQLQDDWTRAPKSSSGHVDLQSFKQQISKRHGMKLGNISEANASYDRFLEKVFAAMIRIRSQSSEEWLDQHGFIYGAFFAYEFYFADARDAERAEGCGSSTPVADNLGITVAVKPKEKKLIS
jgi:hypothetical protein